MHGAWARAPAGATNKDQGQAGNVRYLSSMHGIENTHDCYSLQRRVQCMDARRHQKRTRTVLRTWEYVHACMGVEGSEGRAECVSVRAWPSALH
jgi:hypothetical protein